MRKQMEAALRMLLDSGDITPAGVRVIQSVLTQVLDDE